MGKEIINLLTQRQEIDQGFAETRETKERGTSGHGKKESQSSKWSIRNLFGLSIMIMLFCCTTASAEFTNSNQLGISVGKNYIKFKRTRQQDNIIGIICERDSFITSGTIRNQHNETQCMPLESGSMYLVKIYTFKTKVNQTIPFTEAMNDRCIRTEILKIKTSGKLREIARVWNDTYKKLKNNANIRKESIENKQQRNRKTSKGIFIMAMGYIVLGMILVIIAKVAMMIIAKKIARVKKTNAVVLFSKGEVKREEKEENDQYDFIYSTLNSTNSSKKVEQREIISINADETFGNRPAIMIRINDHKVKALVDTGATTTLVHRKCLTKEQVEAMEPGDQTITGITGKELQIDGKISCQFEIMGVKMNHTAHIVSRYRRGCILGMDLLSRLKGLRIDLATSALVLDDRTFIRKGNVHIVEETWIPANSEIYLKGLVSRDQVGEVFFEPSDEFMEKYEVPVVPSICEIEMQEIPIRMVNFSPKEVLIRPGTKIGNISEIRRIQKVKVPPDKYYGDISLEESNLTTNQKQTLLKTLKQYKQVFAEHEYDLGQTALVKHTIPLTDERPIKQRPYRIPYALQEDVKRQVKEMAEHGIIRKSASPWTAPVVMVKKKDGKMRFCIDFRRVNSITRKDTYPLPRIDEMLDKLSEATIFTTLDLQSGYWQIELEEIDKQKTAFSTGNDLWEFNVLPFGLTGAPATFQRCMNFILMDSTNAMVYIDDIIIFSKSFEQHLEDIRDVMERLQLAGLKIKPTKCEFAKKSVRFLGHIVSAQGIQPDPANTDKVRNFPIPKTVKQVQQFLGLVGYYRKFIQNFARIAAPLNHLIKKENEFRWTDEQQQAFESLRERLLHPPILRYPILDQPFLLMTDASGFALGAILGQKHGDEKDHVIAYASRSQKKHERNYSTTEKEALAIVFAVKQFRHYLYGQKIILYTDHQPLVWLMTHKDTSSRLIRWALQLQEFDLEFKYKMGKANANADCMSRLEIAEVSEGREEILITSMLKETREDEDISAAQDDDSCCKKIRAYMTGTTPKEALVEFWKRNKNNFEVRENVLYYHDQTYDAMVLPSRLRQGIMLEYHDGALGGHLSTRKSIKRIRDKYYWPDMEKEIKEWCENCKICQTRKDTGRQPKVPLKPLPVVLAPMEQVAMDVVGPLPLTEQGNKYIIVFSDYFTKWPEAYAMTDQKSETIAQIFVEKIVYRYGVPRKLLTDRGTNFLSNLMEDISKIFNITRIYTSPYHPQTDGLVERFNQTLLKMLACYTNANQSDWDVHIPSCLFAYRNAVHASTGETPFYLMYLRDSHMPSDIKWEKPRTQYLDVADYKTVMLERLEKAWGRAELKMRYAQESMKEAYDKKTKAHSYKEGDLVMIDIPTPQKGKTTKLKRPYMGPYIILSTTPTNLKVRNLRNKKAAAIIVHVNRCKPIPQEETRCQSITRSKTSKEDKKEIEVIERIHNPTTVNPLWKYLIFILCVIPIQAVTTDKNGNPRTMETNQTKLTISITDNLIHFYRRTRGHRKVSIQCVGPRIIMNATIGAKGYAALCKHLIHDYAYKVRINVTEGNGQTIYEELNVHTLIEDRTQDDDIIEAMVKDTQERFPLSKRAVINRLTVMVDYNDIFFVGQASMREIEVQIECLDLNDHSQRMLITKLIFRARCSGLKEDTVYKINVARIRQLWNEEGKRINETYRSGYIPVITRTRTLPGVATNWTLRQPESKKKLEPIIIGTIVVTPEPKERQRKRVIKRVRAEKRIYSQELSSPKPEPKQPDPDMQTIAIWTIVAGIIGCILIAIIGYILEKLRKKKYQRPTPKLFQAPPGPLEQLTFPEIYQVETDQEELTMNPLINDLYEWDIQEPRNSIDPRRPRMSDVGHEEETIV